MVTLYTPMLKRGKLRCPTCYYATNPVALKFVLENGDGSQLWTCNGYGKLFKVKRKNDDKT